MDDLQEKLGDRSLHLWCQRVEQNISSD
jgi:hypothetical protein